MKKEKTCAILCYVSAMLLYVAAAISFVDGNNASTGVVWLCLGSTMLWLGSVWLNKAREKYSSFYL